MKTFAPLIAGIAMVVAGCTPTLDVAIDGYAAPGTHPPGDYVIVPADPHIDAGDLRFRTFAAELENVMTGRNRKRVEDKKDAAVLVRFGYGVSSPVNDIRTYDYPQYGVTGYQMVPTSVPGPGGTVVVRNTMMPMYGFVGYNRTVDSRIVYTTSVVVEGYDLTKDSSRPPQIWKTTVATTDTTGDARSLLPLMLKAAGPRIGTDTGGMIRIRIDDTRQETRDAR